MAIKIYNQSENVVIETPLVGKRSFGKEDVKVNRDGDLINIFDENNSKIFSGSYLDVLDSAGAGFASALLAFDYVLTLLVPSTGGGGGGGDATAANQVLQLTEMQKQFEQYSVLVVDVDFDQILLKVATTLETDGTTTYLYYSDDGSVVPPPANETLYAVSEYNVITDIDSTATDIFNELNQGISFNKNQLDLMGKLPVSQKSVLASLANIRSGLNPIFWDVQTAGAGTTSYQALKKAARLEVSGLGDHVIAQTLQHYPYFPGKPQNTTFTAINLQPEVNITKRIGRFTTKTAGVGSADFSGICLETTNTTVDRVVYRNGLEVSRQSLPTSVNGVSINYANFNIYDIEYLLLGGAGARSRIDLGLNLNLLDSFSFANTEANVMFDFWFLPFRLEIFSKGGAGYLDFVCSDVSIDGDSEKTFLSTSEKTGFVTYNLANVRYCAMAVKLNNRESFVKLPSIFAESNSNDSLVVEIFKGGTVGSPLSYFSSDDCPIDTAVGGSAFVHTGGLKVGRGGFCRLGQFTEIGVDSLISLGTQIDGTYEEFFVCVTPKSAGLVADILVNFEYF